MTEPVSRTSTENAPRPGRGALTVTRAPAWHGATSLLVVLSGIGLANTTLALQGAWVTAPSWQDSIVSFALAGLGVVLIWRGLRADDPVASLLGYAGGALLWMGFFEWTWRNFTLMLDIQPLMVDGQPVLPGSFLLIQASVFIFLPLTLLGVANKDSRCRMMQWFRRRLHLSAPVTRDNAHRGDPARITATETIFVIWFIYLINISLYDPRLLGRSSEIHLLGLALIGVWAALLIRRLLRIPQPGLALRYAIPTGYLLSILVDAVTMSGLFPAFWIRPFDYPFAAGLMLVVFSASAYWLMRTESGSRVAHSV